MTMTMLNSHNGVAIPAILYVQPGTVDPRQQLDAWEDAITSLDGAMRDVASARVAIEQEAQTLERLEASRVLGIEGGNAETRKARLTLELADDARYQAHLENLRAARERLADADRRVAIQRERCRLLRATLALSDRAA
jgi:hypothetical protein